MQNETQTTLSQKIDEAVAVFDKQFPRPKWLKKHLTDDHMPMATQGQIKDWIRNILAPSLYWQGARDAIAAVEVGKITIPPTFCGGWNAARAEQRRRAALFLKDQK